VTRTLYPLLALVLGLASALPAQEDAGFKVVVNTSNPETSIKRSALSDIFLKKTTLWAHGTPAQPVDQSLMSGLRMAFSKKVHGRNVDAIQNYWQQQVFSGRSTPPLVKLSDAEVLEFVRARPGGVGYVSSFVTLIDGVKVLKLTE
jgi:ABC-type phosphate transport system substrate-binding protein